jgi:hypothetical protein
METIVRFAVLKLLIIVSIFSFGHTGAGKSFTMFGNKEKNPGILTLILESLFAYIYEVFIIKPNITLAY